MPRQESTNYRTQRTPYQTTPRDFVRPYFVRAAGDGVDYPFTVDFTKFDVLNPGALKRPFLGEIQGSTQRVDPIQRRAEIGVFAIPLVDIDREVTRYLANPALRLRVAILATDTTGEEGSGFVIGGLGAFFSRTDFGLPAEGTLTRIEAASPITGYPTVGTITINNEDFNYLTKGVGYVLDSSVVNQFIGATVSVVTPRQNGPGAGLPYAMGFDGTDDYILVGDHAALSFTGNAFAFEWWSKFPAGNLDAITAGILGKRGGPWEYSIHKESGDGSFLFRAWNSAGDDVYSTGWAIPTDGLDHHWVFTANGTNAFVYLDGVQVATVAKTANNMANTAALFEIARGGHSAGLRYMPGQMAGVAVYPAFLSLARAQSHIASMRAGGYLADVLADDPVGVWLLDEDMNAFTGLARGWRGTTPAAHAVNDIIHNGERLKRGQRISIHLGYDTLNEADYGPGPSFQKLELTEMRFDSRERVWTVYASDIQRYTKRLIFEFASELSPVTLGPAHGLTLWLQVALSTGRGTNGPYDVLPADVGAAVAQELVDVAGIERIRDQELASFPPMTFREDQPRLAKDFLEEQILAAYACVSHITQDGKLSIRRFGDMEFRGGAVAEAGLVVSYT